MAYNQVEQAALRIAEPVLEEMGYELVDVEFTKEAQDWHLVVYIDKPGGVTLDDCEAVTRALDPLMDAEPSIVGKHDYFSVSSPGLDRPLKRERDYARSMGKEIEVRLYAAQHGTKQFSGILAAYDAETVTLQVGKQQIQLERKNIAMARLAIHF